jgi:hypothetical protein
MVGKVAEDEGEIGLDVEGELTEGNDGNDGILSKEAEEVDAVAGGSLLLLED